MYKIKILINNLTRSVSSLVKNLISMRKENQKALLNQAMQSGNGVSPGVGINQTMTNNDHQIATKIATGGGKRLNLGIFKKILIPIILFITLLVIGIIAFRFIGNDGNGDVTVDNLTPTIEISQSASKEQSIYAKDPEILAIEEKIKILDAELSSARITDTKINPPVVNLNVSF